MIQELTKYPSPAGVCGAVHGKARFERAGDELGESSTASGAGTRCRSGVRNTWYYHGGSVQHKFSQTGVGLRLVRRHREQANWCRGIEGAHPQRGRGPGGNRGGYGEQLIALHCRPRSAASPSEAARHCPGTLAGVFPCTCSHQLETSREEELSGPGCCEERCRAWRVSRLPWRPWAHPSAQAQHGPPRVCGGSSLSRTTICASCTQSVPDDAWPHTDHANITSACIKSHFDPSRPWDLAFWEAARDSEFWSRELDKKVVQNTTLHKSRPQLTDPKSGAPWSSRETGGWPATRTKRKHRNGRGRARSSGSDKVACEKGHFKPRSSGPWRRELQRQPTESSSAIQKVFRSAGTGEEAERTVAASRAQPNGHICATSVDNLREPWTTGDCRGTEAARAGRWATRRGGQLRAHTAGQLP